MIPDLMYMSTEQMCALLLLLADCRIQISNDDNELSLLREENKQLRAEIAQLKESNA